MKKPAATGSVWAAAVRKSASEKRAVEAIESGDFQAYQIDIIHDWLITLTLLAACLVPFFFVLDTMMMPPALLSRFAVYRALSTILALIQFVIVRRSRPSGWSYLHVYLISLQIGVMISLMTNDLGGFNSSYYAGLNLIIIGANLLMPWKAGHTMANAAMILAMYVGINFAYGRGYEVSTMVNNLFFLSATAVIAVAINHVRFRLIQKEFKLLVELEKSRGALFGEKELVEDRNKSIKSLLDVSGQGFLSFSPDFQVSPEYSKECENIFGHRIEAASIDELLYQDSQSRERFRKGLGLYFSGKFKAEVIFDLLDHSLSIGGRSVRVEYMAVHEGRVMLALTDITEELELQEKYLRENESRAMLLKVISDRPAFASLNKEAKVLFGDLLVKEKGYKVMMRDIHTLKANAGFLGFRKTQEAAHELENYLSDRLALGLEISPEEPIARLTSSYAEEHSMIAEALGPDSGVDSESIIVPLTDIRKVESHVRAHYSDPVLIEALEGFRKKALSELFGRFPHMVADLALRKGKRLAPVAITGGDIPVFSEDFAALIDSFVHIIRNMVDHGIELPGEREAQGKPAEGRIQIDIKEAPKGIQFTFSDDGQGLRFGDIAKKAKDAGLIDDVEGSSPTKLLEFIFRDNFSTNDGVDDISGRGVGLAAVGQAVRKMDGRIRVRTAKGKGTAFTITIPSTSRRLEEVAK